MTLPGLGGKGHFVDCVSPASSTACANDLRRWYTRNHMPRRSGCTSALQEDTGLSCTALGVPAEVCMDDAVAVGS